jgi:hypothetical protein
VKVPDENWLLKMMEKICVEEHFEWPGDERYMARSTVQNTGRLALILVENGWLTTVKSDCAQFPDWKVFPMSYCIETISAALNQGVSVSDGQEAYRQLYEHTESDPTLFFKLIYEDLSKVFRRSPLYNTNNRQVFNKENYCMS